MGGPDGPVQSTARLSKPFEISPQCNVELCPLSLETTPFPTWFFLAREMHADPLSTGQHVLIADDLIATGGTAEAAVRLIESAGARVVECCFVIELPALGGRKRLAARGHSICALCEFEGD
ncbi:MAG TPA: phosphoribosyltransferase family protein [Gemmatimonadales bacterium]|nr:phosphoribosyltransferase family protein [Gemmatimonadales bacterium]